MTGTSVITPRNRRFRPLLPGESLDLALDLTRQLGQPFFDPLLIHASLLQKPSEFLHLLCNTKRFAELLVRIRRTNEPVAATSSKSAELISFKPEPGRTEADGAHVLIAASNCPTDTVMFDIAPTAEGRIIWDAHTGQQLSNKALKAQALKPGEGRIYIVGTPAEQRALMRLILP